MESDKSMLARSVDWLHLQEDHPQLPLSIMRYVPVSVLVSLLGAMILATFGFGALREAFMTNVLLNGLIITIMMIGVSMSVIANLKLWRTGLYLHDLDEIAAQFRIRDEEIEALQRQLKSKASILDCKNMQNLLDNLQTLGTLNVTDMDARMIKSKLGARISRARRKVNFLGGLLVMLGLLGTYLGFLGTIGVVGEVMADMADARYDSANGGNLAMFIASLSAPLQGMGLAFSASLFGLSGSLLVATIQYFSSGTQDHFIEGFSRWLDEQIPAVSAAEQLAGRSTDSSLMIDEELKAGIMEFLQTSSETQRGLAETLTTLNQGVVTMVEQQSRLGQALQVALKSVESHGGSAEQDRGRSDQDAA